MANAFGKLILFGEHAVVYGVPAIACGIGRGLRAEARVEREGPSRLTLLAEERTEHDDDLLAQAFRALLEAGPGRPAAPCAVRVSGTLPPGMNLGFSAAAAVAIARALGELGAGSDDETIRARADAWERVFHGNPSGIDVAAALHGGVVRFRRGEPVRPLAVSRPLRLCVGLSGTKPGPTRAMVESVAARRMGDPERFDGTLSAIAALVDTAANALETGNLARLGASMTSNHELLAGWALSNERLDGLCRTAVSAGALGAKLTGAGGGGAMVALAGAADDARSSGVVTAILEAWRQLGCDGFEVVVGARHD